MKTTKFILLTLAVLCALPGMAQTENAIQVVPFQTKAGATTDDALCFQIAMTNTEPVWGVQFRLKLPDGLTLDEYAFEQVSDRCPSKRGQFFHSVDYSYKDGWYTVVLQTTTNTFLGGNSGALLNVYYLTDSGMAPGVYPIEIKDALLVFDTEGSYPAASTSYVVIGDTSPLKTEKHVDLSCLTGDVPSFVMETINADLAENTEALSVDLTGINTFGTAPEMPGGNTLLYVNADSPAATALETALTPNVVMKSSTGYTCSRLVLDDTSSFGVEHQISVLSASLKRGDISSPWSTLCLPFSLTPEQLENAYGASACAYGLSGVEAPYICFSPLTEATTAHVPYLLETTAVDENTGMINFGSVTLEPCWAPIMQEANGVKFYGIYTGTTSATGAYGITPDCRLQRGGGAADTRSFRALFDLSSLSDAGQYVIRHEDITGLLGTATNLALVDVYDVNGTIIRGGLSEKEALQSLSRGVYIINGQKVFVK